METNVTIEDIEKETQIKYPLNYDYIVIADGSGTKATTPCGWGGYIYDVHKGEKTEFYGGCSRGSNHFAELMPFVYALNTLMAPPATKFAFVSDSEVVVKQGKGEYSKNKNQGLWQAIAPLSIDWIHRERSFTQTHKECDQISRELRFVMEVYEREADENVIAT